MVIHLLWATLRPHTFLQAHSIWMKRAENSPLIKTHIAVSSKEHEDIIKKNFKNNNYRLVLDETDKIGVCHPCYALSSTLEGSDGDIVIFGSDDFMAPMNWDQYLIEKLKGKEGVLLVNDGYQALDFSNMAEPIFSIPIMTFGALKKLNKVIYHPAYYHLCSDAELYLNVKELGLIIDEREKDKNIFEHHHWSNGKRQSDTNDQKYYSYFEQDKKTWEVRKRLSLEERLKV